MTREDAANILDEVKVLDDSMYQYNPAYLQALDMAIAALERERKFLEAGYRNEEVEFYVGGRKFVVREVAQ